MSAHAPQCASPPRPRPRPRPRLRKAAVSILSLWFSLSACAGPTGSWFSSASPSATNGSAVEGIAGGFEAEGVPIRPMTQATMEQLFAAEVDAIIGPSGAIQTRVDGVNVYLISDPVHDRMRIIAPIALTKQLDSRFLEIMLEANFHRTGDARYSTSEGVVYSAFMHPISTLSPTLLSSALAQVLNLNKSFGKQFSSGVLELVPSDDAAPDGEER